MDRAVWPRSTSSESHKDRPPRSEGLSWKSAWLSVEEAATYLGISRDTVYKWIERKAMPAHKVGRLWKFQAEEIDAWVRAGNAAPKAKKKTRTRS